MKIAILLPHYLVLNLRYHGGLERIALDELEYLNNHDHSATLYAASIIGENSNIHRIFSARSDNRILKYIYYALFSLITFRYDILHCYYAPVIAIFSPRRSIIHYQGVGLGELPLYRFAWFRERYKHARFIFCSQWVKESFAADYPEIPDCQQYVVRNAVDTGFFKPADAVRPINATLQICFYARWVERKGVLDVIEAVELLEKKGRKDFTLWLGGSSRIGTGQSRNSDYELAVRKRAASLTTVKFKEEISRNDLPAFLNQMDLGLFTSNTREPFGIALIEMMAAGLPVIAYNIDGPREILKHGVTGFLVETCRPDLLAQRIEWFLDNRQAIKEMGGSARECAEENFGLEIHCRKLTGLYQQIMDQR